MGEKSYRVGELADKAGVTKRTIHYYIGRGLIPPPEGEGLGAVYSDEHLYRIMLIKKLQDGYLPLDEIRKRTSGMALQEVINSLAGNGLPAVLSEQTAEYAPVKVKAAADMSYEDSSENGIAAGTVLYERIFIGSGLEIHYRSDNKKARDMAEVLYKYAQKMMKEG